MQELPLDEVPRGAGIASAAGAAGPTAAKQVSAGFIVAYSAAYFGAWIAVLTPLVVTLALRIQQVDPAGKTNSLSLVAGAGAFVSLVAQPLFGKLSDRTRSRLGMRRPWLVAGAVVGTLGTLVVALASNVTGLLAGWCLALAGFGAVLAALLAILPDQVPEAQRGRVSGVLGMCQSLAAVAGAFLTQALAGAVFWMFMAPATIALVTLLILAVVLPDRTLPAGQVLPPYGLAEFLRSFWVNPRRYPDFAWNWVGRFFLVLGIVTLGTYQVFYLIDHLHEDPGGVTQLVVSTTLVSTVCLVVTSYLSGWLSDRVQRRKVFVVAGAFVVAVGLAGAAVAGSFPLFLVAFAVFGIGEGIYFAVDLALTVAVLPEEGKETAKDMGILNIASALPASLAPAVAPLFLALGGGGNYLALFLAAGMASLLGAWCVQQVRGVR